jgi:hypothetical protein
MDLLTLLLRLPLLPLQGFLRLGELIDEEVQRELRDPARLRHDLEQIQQALESGQISEQEAARAEEEAVTRFTQLVDGETAVTKL